ncbi:MAG: hypothetical protein K9J12_04790 [Melioribacteraceae bacterium]|nr:hypothetical protein [Melioribacteraceae bacterium]MCF8264500.1 hypothetical protein [Melioribacteraceae bacterium]MCF8411913.1 hypothetical protein [Melioribacteraceae bacterium]
MRRILISLMLLSGLVFSQSEILVMPYYMPIQYHDSDYRKGSYLLGIYSSLELDLDNSLEIELDYTKLSFINNVSLKQKDVTIAFNNLSIPDWKFRAGLHYIISDDSFTDKGFTVFGGVGTYRFNSWDAFVSVYYSDYKNYQPGINVFQVSPKFGYTFKLSRNKGIYASVTGHLINLSEELNLGGKKYNSGEINATYFEDMISLNVFFWFGEQVFAAKKDGFLLYNVNEVYKGGYGLSAQYELTSSSFIKLTYEIDNYDEIYDFGGFNIQNSAKSSRAILALGITF